MREMDHEIRLPTLLFFQNGNGWKGSSGLLRFYIRPREEGDDYETVLRICKEMMTCR